MATEQNVQTVNLTIALPLFEKLVYLVNNAGAPLNMKVMDIAEVVLFLNSANLEIMKQLELQNQPQQPQPPVSQPEQVTQDATQQTETEVHPETAG
jgi:hypothetical protein